MQTPAGVPCTNRRPHEDMRLCGRPSDGHPNLSGEPTCPECRAAANTLLLAVVGVLVDRAAELERKDAAA